MIERRAAETGKSGLAGAAWAFVVHAWTYIAGIGWDFDQFVLGDLMAGVEAWIAAGGIGAVWWRNRPSPSVDAAQAQERPAREALERARLPRIVEPVPDTPPSYFLPAEFECKGMSCDCESPSMDPELLRILNNDVRGIFGPTIVNSGYRCPTHNAEIGGVKDSYHMKAMAADIRVPGIDPAEVYEYLDAKYPRQLGLGLYRWGVHVDVRRGSFARKPAIDEPWKRGTDIDLT